MGVSKHAYGDIKLKLFVFARDLSYNQISNISRSMPSTLKFLNLSHNTLQKNWIQTPISATTLDVSNNQGGLRWMENVLWGVSLPKLTRLIFRTNNLKEISLSYDNFPLNPHPFSALDLSGNVNMNFSATADVFNYMNKIITFSADTNSYNDTLRACGNRTDYVVKLRSLPVQYSSQGEAQYDKSSAAQYLYVCSWGYFDPLLTTPAPDAGNRPSWPSWMLGVGVALILLGLGYLYYRRKTRQREEELMHRTTPSSSICSTHEIAGLEIYEAMPIDDIPDHQDDFIATPVGDGTSEEVFRAMPIGDSTDDRVHDAMPISDVTGDRLHDAMPVSSTIN
ncbi:hypothetical protein LEN26_017577 [Aphanomyces euteiches]|nr:hypothetical protein LEN26_017577 [Aphanomyces euteiches]KAH9114586.1 hypothetical protein AeMF1_011336 [Aphanomyces euteiches]KAH9182980.1 hypothetical protein AeNC1_015045 [Aphanomyces euteiches]